MVAIIMTVFAIAVFITFGIFMVIAAILLYWINR